MTAPTAPTAPLLPETRRLFDAVNALDLDGLRDLVDDEFGIVDVDPAGRVVVIDDRESWERYMGEQMGAMRTAGAELGTEILDYRGSVHGDGGLSVVRFLQHVSLPGAAPLSHECVATVVWRRDGSGRWREARWHCSPLGPPERPS